MYPYEKHKDLPKIYHVYVQLFLSLALHHLDKALFFIVKVIWVSFLPYEIMSYSVIQLDSICHSLYSIIGSHKILALKKIAYSNL